MTFFHWDDSYSVGVSEIDAQHKKLFAMLNELYDAMVAEKAETILDRLFSELYEYMLVHFSHEESLLEQADYPDLEAHKQEHLHFVRSISDLKEGHEAGQSVLFFHLSKFLKGWLAGHILGSDKRYSEHLRTVGLD